MTRKLGNTIQKTLLGLGALFGWLAFVAMPNPATFAVACSATSMLIVLK